MVVTKKHLILNGPGSTLNLSEDCYIGPDQFFDNYSYQNIPIKYRLFGTHTMNDGYDKAFNEFIENSTDILSQNLSFFELIEALTNSFQNYFQFSFDTLDPNDNTTYPTFFNNTYIPLSTGECVSIEQDPFNNLSDIAGIPGGQFIKYRILSLLRLKFNLMSRIFRKCEEVKALVLFDHNDHTFNMINTVWVNPDLYGMSLPIITINGTTGRKIEKDINNYSIDFSLNRIFNTSIISDNVIGTLYGKNPNKTIIVGSFYDSWWDQGTADSAIGMGILLGVADYFIRNNITPEYTLRFIAFSGEEYGYIGAEDYTQKLIDSGEANHIRMMIDLNQLGFTEPSGNRLVYNVLTSNEFVKNEIASVVDRTDYVNRTHDLADYKKMTVRYGGPSDSHPFNEMLGCPTVLFLKDTGWTMHHRDGRENGTGDPHSEGDVFKYYNHLDTHVTGEMVLNTTVFYATGDHPDLQVNDPGNPGHDFGDIMVMSTLSTSFEISNIGDGTLFYEVYESCPWISVTPETGESIGPSDIDTITVTVDGLLLMTLSQGVHSYDVKIISNGGIYIFTVNITISPVFIFNDERIHIDDEDGWIEVSPYFKNEWGNPPYTYDFSFGDDTSYHSDPVMGALKVYHKYDQVPLGIHSFNLTFTITDNNSNVITGGTTVKVHHILDDWNMLPGYDNYAPNGLPDFNQKINESWQHTASGFPWFDLGWNYCGQVAACNALWYLDSVREPTRDSVDYEMDGMSHCPIVDDYCDVDDHATSNVDPFISRFNDTMSYLSEFTPLPEDIYGALNTWLNDSINGTGLSYSVMMNNSNHPLSFSEIENYINNGSMILLYLKPKYIMPSGLNWVHWVSVCGTQQIGNEQYIKISDSYRDTEYNPSLYLNPDICTVLASNYTVYAPVHNNASRVSHDNWPYKVSNGKGYLEDYWTEFWDTLIGCYVIIQVDGSIPYADFNYSFINATTVNFNDLSSDNDGSIVSWYWDFDDGTNSTEQNPLHYYDNYGTYDVGLTITDDGGLTNTSIIQVSVYQSPGDPILAYSTSAIYFGTLNENETDTRSFEIWNQVYNTLTYSISENCDWIEISPLSGDSTGEHDTIMVNINTNGLNPGYYETAVNIMSDGGNGIINISVVIYNNPPIANFSCDPSQPLTTDTVDFTDSSSDSDGYITSWYWNFDDGNTNILQNPSHQFTQIGSFNVSLIVSDNNGANSSEKIVMVDVSDNISEILDANQTIYSRGVPVRHAEDGDWGCAQNFTPLLINSISRVELYLRTFGGEDIDFNLTAELRIDNPINGTLLDSVIITPDEIPSTWTWFSIDFNDTAVTAGLKYCIVLQPPPGDLTNSFGYEWGYVNYSAYAGGAFWFTRDGGNLWRDLPTMYDFMFKIYGYPS